MLVAADFLMVLFACVGLSPESISWSERLVEKQISPLVSHFLNFVLEKAWLTNGTGCSMSKCR